MGKVKEVLRAIQERLPGRMVHRETIPGRTARTVPLPESLDHRLVRTLRSRGIVELYSHQALAYRYASEGKDFVVVSGTASGKTLCYALPILDSILKACESRGASCDPLSVPTALLIYPTKALGHDQLRVFLELVEATGEREVRAFTFDGDTPHYRRRQARDRANVLLTNPEMVHLSILPGNARWAGFLRNLRFVVIDELHFYRGIFGSNLGCLLRRLDRIVSYYGGRYSCILSSATIANPREHASRLTGRDPLLIEEDGSPSGEKCVVLWNPPPARRPRAGRKSANIEATEILAELVRNDVQTIAFSRARIVAELIYLYARRLLGERFAARLRAYRAGYLPEERRRIERELQAGKVVGISTTNALELGIDIGTLEAALIVGFPGSIASLRQQAGRAGRRASESVAILVAYDNAVDQYVIRHPEFVFGRSPESALADPGNIFVLANHLCCAACELPLRAEDERYFGEKFGAIVEVLEESACLRRIRDRWYWSRPSNPALKTSLRYVSSRTFSIVDADSRMVIGNVDSISAPELVYPGAVYIHEGELYLVEALDLNSKCATVRRQELDYYTQPIVPGKVELIEADEEKEFMGARVVVGLGRVRWRTVAYDRIKLYTLEFDGRYPVDIPEQTLETTTLFIAPPDECLQMEKAEEAMEGLKNALFSALCLVAMCDRVDLGALANRTNLARPAVCLYDRYPGGLGYAACGFEQVERLVEMAREMIEACECEDGCPACIGLPNPRFPVHLDPDLAGGDVIPDKGATIALLRAWLL